MNRLLLEKTGNAVWISHLDFMRVLQRAFRRAGLMLKHTGGFNQHAYVSLALPLPVGTSSSCEILEFSLAPDCEALSPSEFLSRLNAALPEGIRALELYESEEKLKYLTHLRAELTLDYDNGIPDGTEGALAKLFSGASLPVEKKTKSGLAQVDIRPMIASLEIKRRSSGDALILDTVVCAQNPSLNPALLALAIETYLPDFKPDFVSVRRLEVLRSDGSPFR